MLNKLVAFVRRYGLIVPGDTVICAVSGGADSVALLFGLYLLREKLDIRLEAAHFNHQLRAEESDRDEEFVRELCHRYDIPLHVGRGQVMPGKKGLEAAAREARYAYFATLSGKIATAHTANDNAETVLLHLTRGTGLKGLGGIAPVNGRIIRPMLTVTREEVLAFLQEYCLHYVTDSTNETDEFLRNRLRHRVMPLLEQENPAIAQSLSALALELRQDEGYLRRQAQTRTTRDVAALRQMDGALRSRIVEDFLKENGIPEPERRHIVAVNDLIFSPKPSARVNLPGSVTVERCYDTLRICRSETWQPIRLTCPGTWTIPELGLRINCRPATEIVNTDSVFTVVPRGELWLRSRREGDSIRLSGGTKSLKKLFIDRKIPRSQRSAIPVLADEMGVLAVYTVGINRDRIADRLPAVQIQFTKI